MSSTRARGKLTESTFLGFFWMSLGTGSKSVLQLLFIVILARLLTPRDFGIVSAALVVVGFSQIFSRLGVGPAIVQRPELETRHLRTGFTLATIFGALMAGLIFGFAPQIAQFFQMPELTAIVRLLSVAFLFEGIAAVPESLMQRELRFRDLAAVELGAFSIGFGVVGIVTALLGMGVWALASANLGQTLLRMVLLLRARPHPKRPMLERDAFKDLMYFGGGFTMGRIGNYIGGQGDYIVVGRWLGAEALGIYSRAYQLMGAQAMAFGRVLDKVLFPAMAKVQSEPLRLATAYRRGVAVIALAMFPAGIYFHSLAPEIIVLLLGPQWDGVVAPFQIFALGLIFRTSYKMSDSIARATGAVYERAWRQWAYAILVTGGAFVGRNHGAEGVAICVMVAILVNFLLMAQLSLRLASMSWRTFLAAHLPALALTAIVGSETWFLAEALRGWGLAPLQLIVAVTVILAATLVLLLRFAPRTVLGEDGVWILRTLASYVPASMRLKPILWLVREDRSS